MTVILSMGAECSEISTYLTLCKKGEIIVMAENTINFIGMLLLSKLLSVFCSFFSFVMYASFVKLSE